MNFDDAFDLLINPAREGRRYVSDPHDPGGESKFGISKRSFPLEDIPSLSEERARFLARREFWSPAGCDALPDPLKYPVFDLAYHSGVTRAIKLLQRSVEETEDGILGPRTIQAINSLDWWRIAMRLTAFRMSFQTALATWPSHGKGWTRRNAENLLLSAEYHRPSPPNL